MERPSKRKDVFWLFAVVRGLEASGPPNDQAGKFLIYEYRKDIDAMWQRIKAATKEGVLGSASKVSTRKQKPAEIRGDTDKHVICVYTNGSPEEKERIKSALNEIGLVRHLPYKTDAATEAGEYGIQSSWRPQSGNVIKLAGSGQNLQVFQIHPQNTPTSPFVTFPKRQLSEVSNAVYKLANMYLGIENVDKIVGLDAPNLQIWAEWSPHSDFIGRVTIVLNEKGNNSRIQFAQDDGMFCYERFEWYRKNVLHEEDVFSSDESGDDMDGF